MASVTDIVDVVGAYALLSGGGANVLAIKLLLMKEVGLELNHASAGKQQRWIIGDQGRRRHALAALFLEERQVFLANFGGSHIVHTILFLFEVFIV